MIKLIAYGVAAAVILGILGTVVWKVNHWCNAACEAQTNRADAAELAIQKAKDQAAAIAVMYGAQVLATQAAEVKHEGERNARFEPLVTAAHSLPRTAARTVFPRPAVRVFDDAIRAGNANTAGPTPFPAESPTPTATPAPSDNAENVDVEGVTTWAVACTQLYSACSDQVRGWQDFYGKLRKAQP